MDRSTNHPSCSSVLWRWHWPREHRPRHAAARRFGPERYPVVMGRIAMPSLVAQAAAPSIGTALIEACGFDGALRIFVAAAICNVILAASLFVLLRRRLSSILGAMI